jgi:ketosteroid isomerase-like protein
VTRKLLVATTLLLVGLGCSGPAGDSGPSGGDALAGALDMETERAALRAAAEAYQAAATAKDAEGVVAMYDASALMIPPNGELVEGLEGVRGYRFGFISTPGVSLEFELVRVEVAESGDIGWSFAVGDINIERPDGSMGRDVVRDFHTWRRQPDGSWKVVVDMWNSGMPLDY